MRPFAGFVASKSSNSRPCAYQGTSPVAQQRAEQRGDANGDKRDGCAGSDDLRNALHSILKKTVRQRNVNQSRVLQRLPYQSAEQLIQQFETLILLLEALLSLWHRCRKQSAGHLNVIAGRLHSRIGLKLTTI